MQDVRFYAERKRPGSALALLYENVSPVTGHIECIAAVYPWENSACAGSSISRDVLRCDYRRVSEIEASMIHPELIRHLATLTP